MKISDGKKKKFSELEEVENEDGDCWGKSGEVEGL